MKKYPEETMKSELGKSWLDELCILKTLCINTVTGGEETKELTNDQAKLVEK